MPLRAIHQVDRWAMRQVLIDRPDCIDEQHQSSNHSQDRQNCGIDHRVNGFSGFFSIWLGVNPAPVLFALDLAPSAAELNIRHSCTLIAMDHLLTLLRAFASWDLCTGPIEPRDWVRMGSPSVIAGGAACYRTSRAKAGTAPQRSMV